MAKRDYAKRSKPGGGATRNRTSPPAKRSSPSARTSQKRPNSLVILISISALAALIALVAYLVQTAPSSSQQIAPVAVPANDKATVQESQHPETSSSRDKTPETQAQARTPGESLPLDEVQIDQKERFGFYDLLQESEIKLPEQSAYTSTPRTASLDGRYILQTGSFRSQQDAEAMRARLLLSNLPNVTTQRSEGENGVWYRVTTGPFETFAQLRDATTKLEKLNIHPLKRRVD